MFESMNGNAGCQWRVVGSCGLWISLLGSVAHAGGACCVVQVAGSDQPRVAVSAVHAQSHEDVAGGTRSFAQQGAVARLSWPVGFGLAVSGTAGVPVRSELEGFGAGLGGWIAGAGLSWSYRFPDPVWSSGLSVSASRSEGNLEGSNTWVLSELQGAAHLERSLSFRRSLHAGARMNFGRTDLEHGGQQERVTSDAHPVGFVGWNEAWTEKVATLLEAGYGHGFLVSLGLAFPLR
jgi:hypothetical protein